MISNRWAVLFGILTFAGCATGPNVSLATPESDAAAKQFAPLDGRANLYVARSNDSAGTTFNVIVDGRTIGPIISGTFYLVDIDPGKHNLAAVSKLYSAKATLDAEAGKNYFYEVTGTSSGLTAKPSLGIVLLEEMGKIMVRQGKRAQSSVQE
jgi:hypothetical protein